MSLVTDVRRALNARACFALVDLAYALRDGRIDEAALPQASEGHPGLTREHVQAGHDCIMVLPMERATLDREVRQCVVPLVDLARHLRPNDPDLALVTDAAGKVLLSAHHLEWARRAAEPMTESEAKTIYARLRAR
jgi:hypothetical protein